MANLKIKINKDNLEKNEINQESKPQVETMDENKPVEEVREVQKEDTPEIKEVEEKPEEESSKPSKTKKKKTKNKNRGKSKKTKDELSESDAIIEKRIKGIKTRRYIISTMLIISVIALLVFGTYNTFFKKDLTAGQMTAIVNKTNNDTAFPEENVVDYLKMNFEELFLDSNFSSRMKEVEQVSVPSESIFIYFVNEKDSYTADAYFRATIKTNTGSNDHNFLLTLGFDHALKEYYPMGDLQYGIINYGSGTDKKDNSYMSFENITKETDINVSSAQGVVTNFLETLFNVKNTTDITQYYSGSRSLGDTKAKFEGITSFDFYTTTNKSGYNAVVTYYLAFDEGVRCKTTTYMKISKNGTSWIIDRMQ